MNKKKMFLFSSVASAMIFGAVFSASLNAKAIEDGSNSKLQSLSKLTKTISTIEKYYVDDLQFKEIVDKAIEGLLNNLDAHSGF